jgi:hypothetical protein
MQLIAEEDSSGFVSTSETKQNKADNTVVNFNVLIP